MKCFNYFKYRARASHKSAPELKSTSTTGASDNSSAADSAHDDVHNKSAGPTILLPHANGITDLCQYKAHHLRVFTFSELRIATNDFNRLLKIGKGGFGSVYKGRIKPLNTQHHPIFVAVKKLNQDGSQGHKQWLAEVQFLKVVRHPNLVKLIGYCALDIKQEIQRLLVYEYMPNKTLGDHLFRRSYPALPWEKRLHIMLGAAQGLAYLHEQLQVQVIFRDFKTSNILLDENFQAKLSDFGLAREGPTPGHTHVSTAVVGTRGYAAPDYIETGHLTAESDVWSFGVVLYEILTGRRSLERSRPQKEQDLLEWVKQFPADADGNKFSSIVDPRLENQYSLAAAQKIAKLADSCLAKSRKSRPKMSQVAERLKQIIEAADDRNFDRSYSCMKNEAVRLEEVEKGTRDSESAKRRLAHLVKLGEHVEADGPHMRNFLVMQKAKVS